MALLSCRGIDILIHRAVQDRSIGDRAMFLVMILGGAAMSGVHHLERSALSLFFLASAQFSVLGQRAVRLLAATADGLVVGRGYG